MSDELLRVLARIHLKDEEWVKHPTATRLEAALAVATMDALWPLLEHQLRIQILADTWPFLVQHANFQIDDDEFPCPEDLQDSILTFAKDQFSDRVWQKIGGSFAPHLAKMPPNAFSVGQSFQLKVSIAKMQMFSFEVGPIVIPKSKNQDGGIIRETVVKLQAELTDDLELHVDL